MTHELHWLADVLQVALPAGVGGVFNRIVTDTRRLEAGDVYVALRGQQFDGHHFVAQALQAGASAVLVEQLEGDDARQLVVPDTRLALGLLGRAYRRQWGGQVLAVTGNSGKTTVKEMLGAILSRNAPALVTEGNLNNDFGAPMTLLRLSPIHRRAVIELGANHTGEIAWTASLAEPNIAVVTNVTGAHVGEFGSPGLIAQTKGELVEALPDEGVAVLNYDDHYFAFWSACASPRRVVSFGFDPRAAVRAEALSCDDAGRYAFDLVAHGERLGRVQLAVLGRYNISNALAAAAAAQLAGIDNDTIIAGLSVLEAGKGRMRSVAGCRGTRLLDDSYNANPGAMCAAVDVLASLSGPRWFFMGAMGELGDTSEQGHHMVGAYARQAGIDMLCTFGDGAQPASAAFGPAGRHFDDWDAFEAFALQQLPAGASALVKGSRSTRMERLVETLSAGR